jgi:hypothetical protein
MKKKISLIAALSVIISLLIVSSTMISGVARGQLYDTGYPGGYTGGDYGFQEPYDGSLAIPGMEGLQGFEPGENIMSLAVIPVSQQNDQLYFEVIGFAVTSPLSGQSVVYSMGTPLAGVIDPAANTMQVDLSNIATAISQAGYIDSSQVFNTMRTDPRVVIIEVDMSYQGFQESRTIFLVNSVSIIPPDGRMQAFTLQQPTQLIIDAQSMRIYMVAFPQMITVINNYYGASYPQVLPIVYAQPIPILPPIFVPYIEPVPIFLPSFVSFNPFFFGDGFRPFFHHGFHGGFPIHDRFFWRQGLNDFDRFRGGDLDRFRGGEFSFGGRNELGNQFRPGAGRNEFFQGGQGNQFRQGDGRTSFREGGRSFNEVQQGRVNERFGQGQEGIGQFRRDRGPAGFSGPGTGDGLRISTPSGRNPTAGFQSGKFRGGSQFAGDGRTIKAPPGGGQSTGGNRLVSGDGAGVPRRITTGSGRTPGAVGGGQIGAPAFSGGSKIKRPSGSSFNTPAGIGSHRISSGGGSGSKISAPSGSSFKAPAGRASGGDVKSRRR